MLRLRIQLPKRHFAEYQHLDLLHDALINAWIAAGAKPEQLIGHAAEHWNFAALGFHNGTNGKCHSLIVSTSSAQLAPLLEQLRPQAIRYARAQTSELVDFSSADIVSETDPVVPQQQRLGVLMLSPLVISDRSSQKKRWHTNLASFDLSGAINHRLSRIAERPVNLQIAADSLYLRANPDHSILVNLKQLTGRRRAYVIGMSAPLVLAGSDDDLRCAWYNGIGEKNRNGLGCIGLLEQGVGR